MTKENECIFKRFAELVRTEGLTENKELDNEIALIVYERRYLSLSEFLKTDFARKFHFEISLTFNDFQRSEKFSKICKKVYKETLGTDKDLMKVWNCKRKDITNNKERFACTMFYSSEYKDYYKLEELNKKCKEIRTQIEEMKK